MLQPKDERPAAVYKPVSLVMSYPRIYSIARADSQVAMAARRPVFRLHDNRFPQRCGWWQVSSIRTTLLVLIACSASSHHVGGVNGTGFKDSIRSCAGNARSHETLTRNAQEIMAKLSLHYRTPVCRRTPKTKHCTRIVSTARSLFYADN